VKFNNLRNRTEALEKKSGARDTVLHFADGSTRAIRMRDPLAVLLAIWNRVHWQIGPSEGAPSEGPMPTSQYDGTIDLLARADGMEGNDSFLELLQGEATKTKRGEA
jgi:hypothetical protein